ncbi:hypothetical protein GJAV_G00066770 [Gymnothorax javanicus]|nr:hypothetical protein GJAV_G00066770 [Gymnothorax javanicus]
MYCCSTQESKMDYKRRFLLGGSKQKGQQHQQYQLPELGRTLSAPLCSSNPAPATVGSGSLGSCGHLSPLGNTTKTTATAMADLQQGISKYLDSLNMFCRASALLARLFGGVFQKSRYAKAATQLRDTQEHVVEAASHLTAAIKPEIAKMLMELSTGTTSFKDQSDFSPPDVEVLGRCFLTVMQVHFQFLSQALQKVQPVAQSCLAEALAQAQERRANAQPQSSSSGPLTELEQAAQSWKAASEATSRLRNCGRDGCLAGIEVQRLFCSHNTAIPVHQLKDLNVKIDGALQAYKLALESLGHSEYALKAGFHLNPSSAEAALQGCCSEPEAQHAGRMQTSSQPLQRELPTIPLHVGPLFLKGVSFNESAADNLRLKMQTVLRLFKEDAGLNGLAPRDTAPVLEVLNQVCPSSWRGACKTAVQLLFGQAGLVVVDTAQIENKEAYAPQITLEGTRIIVQVPSAWCLKEDPATMSLLQRSLDPEKTLGLVDVLYTAVFDLSRWTDLRDQALPTIQIQLQRESLDYGMPDGLPARNGLKPSSGLPKSISKLTSRFTKKASANGGSSGSYSSPGTPSCGISHAGGGSFSEEKAKVQGGADSRLQSFILNTNPLHVLPDSGQLPPGSAAILTNGYPSDLQGMNLPTDQEMQDVIDFLSGFNMGKSQQDSPLVKRRNSAESANAAKLKPPSGTSSTLQMPSHGVLQPSSPKVLSQQQQELPTQKQPPPQRSQHALQSCQHLLQPVIQHSPAASQLPSQRPPLQQAKWPSSSPPSLAPPPPLSGLTPIRQLGQWGMPCSPNLSSDLISLGLVSSYVDSVMSDALGHKPRGLRNNTWPNRDQSEGSCGSLGDPLPFDQAVGSDPEFARYVAGVNRSVQQKRQAQHVRRPSDACGDWPIADEAHRTWPRPEYFSEGDGISSTWSANQGDSASSSDETSSANGDSLFSMFSGPDLAATVNQRRKHSCGEQEVCPLPLSPLHHSGDDSNQENKTKTWPPKAPWQHCAPHSNTLPNPGSSLHQQQHQHQQQQRPVQLQQPRPDEQLRGASEHKPICEAFKSLSFKQEHQPSFLHQY